MPRILFVSGFHPQTRARDLAYEFERFGPLSNTSNSFSVARIDSARTPALLHPLWQMRKDESPLVRVQRELSRKKYRFASTLSSIDYTFRREQNAQTLRPLHLSCSYAFVEFRNGRDAEDAYYDMHGRHFEGSRLSIQWAKNPPSSVWRYERRSPPRRDRERSRSPRRKDDRDRDHDRDRDRDSNRDRRRARSRSPDRRGGRTPSPDRPDRRRDDRDRDRDRNRDRDDRNGVDRDREHDRERDRDRARTPPLPAADEGTKKDHGVTGDDRDHHRDRDDKRENGRTPPYDN
ncbi:hypothetical protein D9756_008004 [Leucocoprinus leucothites]|uniref:RRM domain-containing protein n=1 Tax=Leucocoprinus leucothites TaxID=201217 RepID=A0A8H5D4C6_9AGAR|nr:hypothetical protein D9756_008004 [Leucoagaricus leucothites]